jgi:hypothetical protein
MAERKIQPESPAPPTVIVRRITIRTGLISSGMTLVSELTLLVVDTEDVVLLVLELLLLLEELALLDELSELLLDEELLLVFELLLLLPAVLALTLLLVVAEVEEVVVVVVELLLPSAPIPVGMEEVVVDDVLVLLG